MTKNEITAMVIREEKRLGVGSQDFLERHREIMEEVRRIKGDSTHADKNVKRHDRQSE